MVINTAGRQTKSEITSKALNSPTKINTKKTVSIDTEIVKRKYRCSCCGNEYDKPNGNFSPTNLPLFKDSGFYPVCKSCMDSFCSEMTDVFSGNEEKAIEYICQMQGVYFNESPLAASNKISAHRSRLSTYISKVQIKPWIGKTYIDTLKEKFNEENGKLIESIDDIDDVKEYRLTPKMIKFWGAGYDAAVYPTLQGYYDELLKLCENKPDVKKQKMMKNLCLLEYQMSVNIQAGKDIGTLSNSYKTMFEAAELKTDDADISNDAFGKWILDIEKYCPAEMYDDKKKYHDFFGIVDYIERFMFRPLRNLIFGTKEKEKEFWINDENDEAKGGE